MTTPLEALRRLQAWRDGAEAEELGIGYCAGNDAFAADVIALLADAEKTVSRILEPKQIVGYMVHSGAVENAALYPLSRHAEALDAADRWKASITSLVCAPGGLSGAKRPRR